MILSYKHNIIITMIITIIIFIIIIIIWSMTNIGPRRIRPIIISCLSETQEQTWLVLI